MERKTFLPGLSTAGILPLILGKNMVRSVEPGATLPKMDASELKDSYWYICHLISLLISSGDANGSFALVTDMKQKVLSHHPM